jgi:Tol biopolymer transport system component
VAKFQLGSASPPIKIHEIAGGASGVRPMWSPDGKWITILLAGGLGVVSPDGQKTKVLINRNPSNFAAIGWSRDGRGKRDVPGP